MSSVEVAIGLIEVDCGTQFRASVNEGRVEEYAELIRGSKGWPFKDPCDVFFDGKRYYLVDGFHRYTGAKQVGCKALTCVVHEGTLRDAIKFALGANSKHGLHRSNEDKRKAVAFVLADAEWSKLSSRAIAEMCGVSYTFVDSFRKVATDNGCQLSDTRIGKDGKERSLPQKQVGTPNPIAEQGWTDVGDDEPVAVASVDVVQQPTVVHAIAQDPQQDAIATIKALYENAPDDYRQKLRELFKELSGLVEPQVSQTQPVTEVVAIYGRCDQATKGKVYKAIRVLWDTDKPMAMKTGLKKPSLDEVKAYCDERKNGIDAQEFIDHYEACGWVQGRGRKPVVNWKACVNYWERTRKKEKESAFVPPTVAEVKAYFEQRKNGFDAERFCAYYQQKGWIQNGNPIKDWKACVVSWEKLRREKEEKEKVKVLTDDEKAREADLRRTAQLLKAKSEKRSMPVRPQPNPSEVVRRRPVQELVIPEDSVR